MEIVGEKIDDDVPWHTGKTSARFLAVQGAYVMMFNDYTRSDLPELLDYLCEMQGVMELCRLDRKLLSKILEYMMDSKQEIDDLITRHISEKWAMDRINLVSLAIIRAGICELLCSKIDESIIINEYAGLASIVLEDGEINFVNAILNKAKSVRTLNHGEGIGEGDAAPDFDDDMPHNATGERAMPMAANHALEPATVPAASSGGAAADLLTVNC